MLLPLRLRAAWTSQRTPSDMPAVAADLDRDLVGGATDAAGLDLDDRRGVAQRGLEHLEPGALGLEASARASAWRRMRSARPCLPSRISFDDGSDPWYAVRASALVLRLARGSD